MIFGKVYNARWSIEAHPPGSRAPAWMPPPSQLFLHNLRSSCRKLSKKPLWTVYVGWKERGPPFTLVYSTN